MRIVEADSEADLRKAAALLRGFPDHQRTQYAAHIAVVSRYFDEDAYGREMTNLGAIYAPPQGCVLMTLEGEEAVGAVCLRRLDDEACEMKRLYVPIAHRRKGIAEALSRALMDAARTRGYSVMRLDTGSFMVPSQALYRKIGFTYIPPYYTVADDLRDGLVFMEIQL